MKTIINVDIHASGMLNDSIIRIITSNNEGKYKVYTHTIQARCFTYQAEWPSISPKFDFKGTNDCLEIYENEKHTLTLHWKEIYQLNETEAELLTQQNLS